MASDPAVLDAGARTRGTGRIAGSAEMDFEAFGVCAVCAHDTSRCDTYPGQHKADTDSFRLTFDRQAAIDTHWLHWRLLAAGTLLL